MATEAVYLYFYYNSSLTSTEKLNVSYPLLIAISVVLVALVVWALWRCVWEIIYLLDALKKTEFYKAYADP
jgi:hypothetical protein